MVARLQKFIVLTLLAAACSWALYFASHGSPWWAAAGLALLLGGHAPVLALEFALAAWHNRHDPAPRARLSLMAVAWSAEVGLAVWVFGWLQPFRSRALPDLLPDLPSSGADASSTDASDPVAAATRTAKATPAAAHGVLLVHGYLCNRGFWNPWLARLRARGVPCLAVNLEPVFGAIDDYAATLDAAAATLFAASGERPVVVVAHSMGGLAVRAWLAGPTGAAAWPRVHRVVTLGSPHRGTLLARFASTRNAFQMRPASTWQQALAAREQALQPTRFKHFTCFYSHCDNIVFPASNATLPGADNRHVRGSAHVQLAHQPEVFIEVLRWVSGDAATDAAPDDAEPNAAPAVGATNAR